MLNRVSVRLRRVMTGWAVRWEIRRRSEDMITLRDCWSDINHCVVCWPEGGMDVLAAEIIFHRLGSRFPHAAITTIALPGVGASPPDIGVRVIRLNSTDFNAIGFPRRRLKEMLIDLHADLAVDLSPDYNALAAFCCQFSGARIKIGFDSTKGENILNFLIAPLPERSVMERYRVLARYIG